MIRNIKELKLIKKVIGIESIPDRDGMIKMSLRELGNIPQHNGIYYYVVTCDFMEGKIRRYYSYYFIATNKDNWAYGGELNLGGRESEDISLKFIDNKPHLFFEDKTKEKEDKTWIINHYVANNIGDEFTPVWGKDYQPQNAGIDNLLALYSPLADLIEQGWFIVDGRKMSKKPHTEFIMLAPIDGDYNIGNSKVIIEGKDFADNIDSLGVGGSIRRVDGVWVIEFAMLLDYNNGGNARWATGLGECVTLDGNWKLLNKELKDTEGNTIYAGFFEDNGKWYALASPEGTRKDGIQNIYLAEIIPNENVEPVPPSNGGNMRPKIKIENNKLILTDGVSNATMYRWQCDKAQGYWIGDGTVRDIPKHLQVNGNEFWCYAMVDGNRTGDSDRVVYKSGEPPQPNDNDAIVAEIRSHLLTVENSVEAVYDLLDDIK